MENIISSKLAETNLLMNREKISRLSSQKEKNDDKKLKQACKDFEGIMLHQIMKEMRKTVPEGGILPESEGNNIWKSLYDEKLSYELSSGENGTGFAKFLYDDLSSGLKKNLKP